MNSSPEYKDNLLGVFEEEYLASLKSQLNSEEFTKVVKVLADHSIKALADLHYDFNTAVNAILRKFPGQATLKVSEVHDTLRELGIVDYAAADFAYIEETMKRFGVLIVPDPV